MYKRQGIGRLTFFAFAQRARWNTVYEQDGIRYEYYICLLYTSDVRKIRHSNMSAFQERYYAKIYRLRIVEQKRFSVKGVKFRCV